MKAYIAIVSTAAIILIGVPAYAQQYQHKALAENVGALAVAKRWCDDYQVDLESGIRLAVSNGVNPLKGKFNLIVEETKEKLELAMANLGSAKFCAITYERYRPGGPVPGFMVRK
ncbi:hypothetical protein [Methylobacterium sp. CCH5-D2]|uniref:hypothetical protein n=1 Tax=Methylobacterium sp. CCH5-D2 TaxID=1768765 RepID=UPI000A72DC72|nr:hypothetical protein [Methylobacterium sp. CCH5-D2]